LDVLVVILFVGACFFVHGVVHESGHYLAGLAGGIPAGEMRIRLFTIPGHVVLRHGDRWVSPREHELFVESQLRHLVTIPRVYLFVAGGMLLETFVTSIAALLLVQFGLPKMAIAVLAVSLVMFVPYLILDSFLTWRARHACGDFSGMWFLAKWPTAPLVMTLLVIRVLLVWYAAVATGASLDSGGV
jgi:hypothetical protein